MGLAAALCPVRGKLLSPQRHAKTGGDCLYRGIWDELTSVLLVTPVVAGLQAYLHKLIRSIRIRYKRIVGSYALAD